MDQCVHKVEEQLRRYKEPGPAPQGRPVAERRVPSEAVPVPRATPMGPTGGRVRRDGRGSVARARRRDDGGPDEAIGFRGPRGHPRRPSRRPARKRRSARSSRACTTPARSPRPTSRGSSARSSAARSWARPASARGLAVPHTRHPTVQRLVGTVALSRHGVDFAALDGDPVDIFFLLISPPNQPGDHLRALENISRHLKDDRFVSFLRPGQDDLGAGRRRPQPGLEEADPSNGPRPVLSRRTHSTPRISPSRGALPGWPLAQIPTRRGRLTPPPPNIADRAADEPRSPGRPTPGRDHQRAGAAPPPGRQVRPPGAPSSSPRSGSTPRGIEINGKSILDLTTLAAECGTLLDRRGPRAPTPRPRSRRWPSWSWPDSTRRRGGAGQGPPSDEPGGGPTPPRRQAPGAGSPTPGPRRRSLRPSRFPSRPRRCTPSAGSPSALASRSVRSGSIDPRGLRPPPPLGLGSTAYPPSSTGSTARSSSARAEAEAAEADARSRIGPQYADILAAHARMIADPTLRRDARLRIERDLVGAEHAVSEVLEGARLPPRRPGRPPPGRPGRRRPRHPAAGSSPSSSAPGPSRPRSTPTGRSSCWPTTSPPARPPGSTL